MDNDTKNVKEKVNQEIKSLAEDQIVNFPIKLENTLNLPEDHLKDQYEALKYFSDYKNINSDLEKIIENVLSKLKIAI